MRASEAVKSTAVRDAAQPGANPLPGGAVPRESPVADTYETPSGPSAMVRYGAAAAATALALLLRFGLDPVLDDQFPYETLFAAIALVAWFAGWRPALVSTLLGFPVAEWLFVYPRHTLGIHSIEAAVALATYLGASLALALFSSAMHKARADAAHKQRELKKVHDELEIRVADRTAELEKTMQALEAERRRFIEVLDVLPAYIVLLAPDFHVRFANRFFRERFGEAGGRRCFEHLFGRTEPCEVCETHRVLTTGKPQYWEWTGPDGRDYDVFDFLFTDADGTALILEMGIDITERKRAQEIISQQADHYTTMLAASSDGFWLFDLEGRLLDVNDAYCRMIGYSREELLNLSVAEIEAAESAEDVSRHIRSVVETGFDRLESRHRTKAGSLIDVEISVCFSRHTRQMISFIRNITLRKQVEAELERYRRGLEELVNRRTSELEATNAQLQADIVERRRAEQALSESEARYRSLVDMAPDAVLVHAGNRILYCNTAALRLLGAGGFADVRGRGLLDLVNPGDRDTVETRIRQVLEGSKAPLREMQIVRLDGQEVPVEATAAPIHWEGMPAVQVILRDITERKLADERLREAQKLESVGLLAGGIAHDFNNLLVGVIGSASLAKDMLPEDNPALPFLERIISTGEQAAHLTRQMLAYSGKGQFLLEPVNLSAVVSEMADLVQPSIPKKIALQFDLSSDLPHIEADRSQMQQVFMNLVLNAAEAIGSSAGLISVKTGVREIRATHTRYDVEGAELRPGTYAYLEVRDTGSGMDDRTRARIFDPFFSTKFMGRGLGLAAVAGIVRAQRGAIKVTSAPGKGSCFTAVFPASGHVAPAPVIASGTDVIHGSGTVLVVDDEEVVRETAKKALERCGYEVLLADAGPAAIDTLKRHPREIALVILDLSMPGMNGQEVLPELRRIRPGVKVAVSSGYAEGETMKLFQGHRVSGFIQKPYTSSRLAEKVYAIIG